MMDTQAHEIEVALGYPAWRGYLAFALADDQMRAAFERDSGFRFGNGVGPGAALAAMIDEASGYAADRMQAFAIWASEHYGEEFCPPAMRELIAAKRGEKH